VEIDGARCRNHEVKDFIFLLEDQLEGGNLKERDVEGSIILKWTLERSM
jgi:hypothetical protein